METHRTHNIVFVRFMELMMNEFVLNVKVLKLKCDLVSASDQEQRSNVIVTVDMSHCLFKKQIYHFVTLI